MNRHEAAYRKEWATLTGKSEREIYVPFALRDPEEVPVVLPEPELSGGIQSD